MSQESDIVFRPPPPPAGLQKTVTFNHPEVIDCDPDATVEPFQPPPPPPAAAAEPPTFSLSFPTDPYDDPTPLLQTSTDRKEIQQYLGQLPQVKDCLVKCKDEGHFTEHVKTLVSVLCQRIIALERQLQRKPTQTDHATQTQIEHIRASSR